MATLTPNNNLKKPLGSDYVRVADFNGNADILDAAIGNLAQLDTSEKTSLVLAINQAATMGGGHPPYLDEATNTWWQWDQATLQYVDTETPPSAAIEVASTQTLPAGEDATVENVGTEIGVRLAFGIPKGDKGDKGDQGEQGETGPQGDKGDKGDQGEQGETGPQGDKGDPGTGLTILGTFGTLAALEAAVPSPAQGEMYNVGTAPPYNIYMYDEAQGWIDLGVLQGSKGDKGDTGPQGPQGIQGPEGEQGPQGPQGNPTVVNNKSGPTITLNDADIPYTGVVIPGADDLREAVDAAHGLATTASSAATVAQTTANAAATVAADAQTTANSKTRSTFLAAVLYASAWEDGEQTITNAGIPAPDGTGGDIKPPQGVSMDALDAYEAARPWVYVQQAGSIGVRARGTVPTVDIPIVMEVRQ